MQHSFTSFEHAEWVLESDLKKSISNSSIISHSTNLGLPVSLELHFFFLTSLLEYNNYYYY